MKTRHILYTLALLLLIPLQSCFVDDDKHIVNDYKGNFDYLWKVYDEYYCFFEYKNIDWDSIYTVYEPQVHRELAFSQFFDICSNMLAELQDGHVNLYWPYDASHNWSWMEKYPVNYNERIIDEHYLDFKAHHAGGLKYMLLPQNIGYIYYGSFSSSFTNAALDYILNSFSNCDGIIIDIRSNGGGAVSNVNKLASRFTDRRILTGYSCHKSGKGHNDFSEPEELYLEPSYGVRYTGPIALLTNRGSYSAANDFTRIMKVLHNVTIIGDSTGGGSGLPINFTLPCGVVTRLSTQPILDINMEHTEFGIAPDIKVDMAPDAEMRGRDAILDCAIERLSVKP